MTTLVAAPALAATEFGDIPFLQARIGQVLESEPTGAEVEWSNAATGNSGTIRVLRTYFPAPDKPCRDYQRSTRQAGGADVVVRGTGCRDPSGRWRLKEEEQQEAAKPEGTAPPEATASGAPAAAGSSAAGGAWSLPPPEPEAAAAAVPAGSGPPTELAPPLPEPAPRSAAVTSAAAARPVRQEIEIDMPTPSE